MADQPEVIQHELEETRHSLAEKLGQIGEKISGTVENVTETVENVSEMVGNVSTAVENTVEGVTETVEAMGETAQETVSAVKHAFDIPKQVEQHPWVWFCGSVALGFVGGKLLGGIGRPERSYEPRPAWGNGYASPRAESQVEPSTGQTNGTSASKTPSWISKVTEHFGSELNQLKSLALGTLFGVARDMVTQSLPDTLKTQLVDVFNNITEAAGGKPIQGEVFPDEQNESQGGSQGGSREGSPQSQGEEHEGRNPTESDRRLGAVERKGKAGVAKSNRR